MPPATLNFGLLFFPNFQWLDAAGAVDYINNHSHAYASLIPDVTPETLEKTPHIKWHYISSDLNPITEVTSGPPLTPSCTYDTCPPLDYLIVPGPLPFTPLPDGCEAFLKKLLADDNFKALLMICTGSLMVAKTGILNGRRACSNKVALRTLAKAGALDMNVKWVGDRRWIVDGRLWSAAGVTSGIDLAAEFARVHFDPALVKLVREISEYDANPDQPDPFAFVMEGVALPQY